MVRFFCWAKLVLIFILLFFELEKFMVRPESLHWMCHGFVCAMYNVQMKFGCSNGLDGICMNAGSIPNNLSLFKSIISYQTTNGLMQISMVWTKNKNKNQTEKKTKEKNVQKQKIRIKINVLLHYCFEYWLMGIMNTLFVGRLHVCVIFDCEH